jgi:hypothetical protein
MTTIAAVVGKRAQCDLGWRPAHRLGQATAMRFATSPEMPMPG